MLAVHTCSRNVFHDGLLLHDSQKFLVITVKCKFDSITSSPWLCPGMVMQEDEMAAKWGLISFRLRAVCILFCALCINTCWNCVCVCVCVCMCVRERERERERLRDREGGDID